VGRVARVASLEAYWAEPCLAAFLGAFQAAYPEAYPVVAYPGEMAYQVGRAYLEVAYPVACPGAFQEAY